MTVRSSTGRRHADLRAGFRRWLPFLAYAGLAGGLARLGPTLATLGPALVLYSTLFGLLILLVVRRGEVLDDPRVLLGGALLLRLVFLPVQTDLSVDPFRYLWDAWLTADGVNPFGYTPSDPELVGRQQGALFQEMNSKDFYSIYPPLSQWLFLPAGVLYESLGLRGSMLVLKGTLTAAELAGLAFLLSALRKLSMRPRHLALYAWNPLVLLTIAGVGHSEGGLVLALGILAWGLAAVRPPVAWAGLGLAVVSKGVPLLAAPLLFRYHRSRLDTRATWRAAILGLAPVALLSLPFAFGSSPRGVLASAELYVRLFEFNPGLHAVLAWVADGLLPGVSREAAGPFLGWTVLASALWLGLRHTVDEPRNVLRGMTHLFGIYLIAATTVHPWYLLWGLSLIAFTTRTRGAWIWASWAAFPTYFAYTGASGSMLALLFWGGVAGFLTAAAAPRAKLLLLPLAGRRKARQIGPHVRGGTVLDLGAGEGYVGAALHRPDRTIFLADVDTFFRTRLPAFRFDGRALPLPPGSVDTVVLSLVLHHADDPDRLLREALRVARARVVVTESTYRYAWERSLLEKMDRLANRGRGEGSMGSGEGVLRFDTVEGWMKRIQTAGGRVVLERRLNRFGHRHHLLVAEARDGAER